jgi:hypothetical protein
MRRHSSYSASGVLSSLCIALAGSSACAPAVPAAASSAAAKAESGLSLAFPGAQGFGAAARGGRGGDVYHVTTLADAGPGSLRDGVESARGPRTVVFEVAGTIALASPLRIREPYLTLAGQSAPGPGITLKDEGIVIRDTHDIVIRHLRVRRGDVRVRAQGRPSKSSGLDAVSIDRAQNIILDHLSLSWSCDELLGIVRSPGVTVQWSILAEPLGDPALHPYGREHAFGINASANLLSVHHNLFANYVMRGPQFEANDATNTQGFDVAMEAANNVLFDYKKSGSRYTTGIAEHAEAASDIRFLFHFAGNHYLRAEANAKAPDILAVTKYGTSPQVKVWLSGNLGPSRPGPSHPEVDSLGVEGSGVFANAPRDVQDQVSPTPLFASPWPVSVSDAETALTDVLASAGANRQRDAVDARVLRDVRERNFRPYLRSQAEVGGWQELQSERHPTELDQDRDGMADAWERQHGLNPDKPDDRNGDRTGVGYTTLEEYRNQRA